MGWTNSHLHEFTIGKKRYTEHPQEKEGGLECGKYRFGNLVKQKNRKILYLYDFGDSWVHELILEENHYLNPEMHYKITYLDSARACPPEDVGVSPVILSFVARWLILDTETMNDSWNGLVDSITAKHLIRKR